MDEHKEGKLKQTSAEKKMSHFSQLYIFYFGNYVGGEEDTWIVSVAEKVDGRSKYSTLEKLDWWDMIELWKMYHTWMEPLEPLLEENSFHIPLI